MQNHSMSHIVRTVCDPNCNAKPRCGIDALVVDEKIVSIRPAEYPAQLDVKSRICMMGMARLEYQYHPDRLLYPLRRIGRRGEGRWERITWEVAIDLFIESQKSITDRYGSRSVLFSQYSGASGILGKGSGTRYAAVTGSSMTSLVGGGFDYGLAKGLNYTFGFPPVSFWSTSGHSFEDAVNSELTLIWGGNPVVTRSVDYPPLREAQRRGTKLVCIDPTQSETSKICDSWIPLRPGTDGALALALLNQIIVTHTIDKDFLLQHTNAPFLVRLDSGALLRESDLNANGSAEYVSWCADQHGPAAINAVRAPELAARNSVTLSDGQKVDVASVFELLRALAAIYTPEVASEITDVPADTIRELAAALANAKPAAVRAGYGIDRYYYSDLTIRAIAALAVVTGNIGKPGGGITINGGDKVASARARSFYSPDGKAPHRVFNVMDADAAVRQGTPYPIKMECISFGNPFNQGKPNRQRVISEYVGNLDFLVVIDHFMTDTAKYADLVLPACTIFERLDIVVDRFIHLQQPAVKPEGEAKSDFDIFCLLAKRAGYGDFFDKSPEEYIDDIFKATPELDHFSYELLAKEKVLSPWSDQTPHISFADLKFPTASGRIELYCEQLLEYDAELPYYKEPIEASPKNPLFKKYPLVFLSPHSRSRIHSTFANMKTIKREAEPLVRLSEKDANDRKIANDDIVVIFNDRGHLKIRCRIDNKVRPGCVIVEEGYWASEFLDGDMYSLTHDHFNPTGLTYIQNDVLVDLRRAEPISSI